ncbi:MAG: exo-alpha-sialidase, partial [Opitutaceae bacterium]
ASQPGTWYAGVDDAALFVSRDDGDSWDELTGLTKHPTRPRWTPGFGGLCLHSIVVDLEDPQRLWVGISAVGVFRSDDAGETWKLCNEGLHNVAPEFIKDADLGRCVHKMVGDPARSGVLYLQFHGGVFKSENAGDSWTRISGGLPHDFGFPMAATARDLFVVPLLADSNRVVPDGALKVWRSRDRGRSWRAMTKGLPQKEHFVGVLRDAMTTDPLTPAGVYLGTTGGEVFYSIDDGEAWEKLPAQFPRITTLKTWLV